MMELLLVGALLLVFVGLAGGHQGDDASPEPADPDPIAGGPDNDDLSGTQERDILLGLGGLDRLSGLGGDDDLYGGAGSDSLFGGAGDDLLNGGTSTDYLEGGAGNDILDSRTGDDTNPSFATNDRLSGGDGDDWLIAGGGEIMVGDAGSDIFDLTSDIVSGVPVLVDYTPGEDRIVIRYDPEVDPNPSFEIEPDPEGQNFYISVGGGYVGIIQGEFGINYDDFVLVPIGGQIPARV